MRERLEQLLSPGQSLRDLARSLGVACLDSLGQLDSLWSDPNRHESAVDLQEVVRDVDLTWWFDPARSTSGYSDLLAMTDVADRLDALDEEAAPLSILGVLRGICARPLTHFYTRTWDQFGLQRGDLVPKPLRPTHTAFGRSTPSPNTMEQRSLLFGTDFRFFPGPTSPIRIVLDFSDRDNLDGATWIGDEEAGALPPIATIHPYADADDLAIDEITDDTFFWVAPRQWKPDEVIEQLRQAAESAAIAVLPELSLPEPAALGSEIAEAHTSLPGLIVAGSAHAESGAESAAGQTRRVNRLITYLHGAELLRHDKVHSFIARYLGPEHGSGRWEEDLTRGSAQITIAAGTITRLAAVICADLNDAEIPLLLEQALVNLLLVPALTVEVGAFESAGSSLARVQGVMAIVNGTAIQPPESPTKPFMAAFGVPIPVHQVHYEDEPGGGRRAVGVATLGVPPFAFEWLG